MLKRILSVVFILALLPVVYAGELETAIKNNQDVFLYLYTSFCGTCKLFNPYYENLSKSYDKQFKFIKINAETPYGYGLIKSFNAQYVPFVVMINSKKVWQIDSSCLTDNICTSEAIKKFKQK